MRARACELGIAAFLLSSAWPVWGQQSAAPPDLGDQVKALSRQVASMRNLVRNLRDEVAAEAATRQQLEARLISMQGQVRALQAALRSVQQNSVMDLNGYLHFDNTSGYPTAVFSGINLQVVNGTGVTQRTNGLGNLIVGYNGPRTSRFTCSIGYHASELDCRAKGGTWAQSHKSGSHNIVAGDSNSYSSWGGVVLGVENAISAPYATISGGAGNLAGGDLSIVSGGSSNTAGAMYGAVSGGLNNTASGAFSVVGGGSNRVARGADNWTAGGLFQDR